MARRFVCWATKPTPGTAVVCARTLLWVSDLAFEERMDRHNWVVVDHHIANTTPTKARLVHDESKSACMRLTGCAGARTGI